MFKKILVPIDVDHPETAKDVYQRSVEIAKLSDAEIRLISVMPGFGMPIVASYISDEIRKDVTDRFKESLEKFIKENCREHVSHTVRTGKNWEEIIKAADKWGADLIVVHHNRRHEINEVFSRSCSQRVADNANCSVLRLRNIQG
jgi:nucleotide-binding universal stress UspA family protein